MMEIGDKEKKYPRTENNNPSKLFQHVDPHDREDIDKDFV